MTKYLYRTLICLLSLLVSGAGLGITAATYATSDGNSVIFHDQLASGWSNWSWNSTVQPTADQVYAGQDALRFSLWGGWAGLYLHADQPVTTDPYTYLTFATHAAQTDSGFGVYAVNSQGQPLTSRIPLASYTITPGADGWKVYSIPLSDLRAAHTQLGGIVIQDGTGNWQPDLYIDEIALTAGASAAALPSSTPVPTSLPTPPPSSTPSPAATSSANTVEGAIYQDGLADGWQNWSWNSAVQLDQSSTTYAGSRAISFQPYGGWAGLYLHTTTPLHTTAAQSLQLVGKFTDTSDGQFGVALYDGNYNLLHAPISLAQYGSDAGNGWRKYSIPLAALTATDTVVTGLLIQEIGGSSHPAVYLDNILLLGLGNIPTPTPLAGPIPTSTDLQGYTTQNGQLLKDGSPIVLHGVNWFGFDTQNHVVHGLWARNWQEMIAQIKSTGFNAVRLPLCPAALNGSPVGSGVIDYTKNPDLQGLNSQQILDKVVSSLDAQGTYVLLDFHRPDCQNISDLWYTSSYSESQWITDLQTMASRYSGLSHVFGIDLKNEPKETATWGTGNQATDWNTAAEKAGQVVLTANPRLLVFIEGIQSNPTCSSTLSHWWGGNLEPLRCTPINPAIIPQAKQVFSPHVYGPDVYAQPYFGDASFPTNMPAVWSQQFGAIRQLGDTVIPGEWGGKYGTDGGAASDVAWQDQLVNYYIANKICSSFYWSWNPDSGDTGGILQDDWKTPWSSKLDLLNRLYSNCHS